jgi:amino acid transporter
MIMVCLFFYQPFENQITDYVTISMEIALVIFIIIVMIFGLNLVQENSAHYMGIVGAAITVIAGIVGLCWLGYLTYTGILKYKK